MVYYIYFWGFVIFYLLGIRFGCFTDSPYRSYNKNIIAVSFCCTWGPWTSEHRHMLMCGSGPVCAFLLLSEYSRSYIKMVLALLGCIMAVNGV